MTNGLFMQTNVIAPYLRYSRDPTPSQKLRSLGKTFSPLPDHFGLLKTARFTENINKLRLGSILCLLLKHFLRNVNGC